MLNGHQRLNHRAGRRSAHSSESPPDEVGEPGLRKFWTEKYRFNIATLGLNRVKAREWATRAVRVKIQMLEIEVACLHRAD